MRLQNEEKMPESLLAVIEKALKDIGRLKEQHYQQGHALVRLRQQMGLVEDSYLEQESVLDNLSALLSCEINDPRFGSSKCCHMGQNGGNMTHADALTAANLGKETKVRGNAIKTSDQGEQGGSEGQFPTQLQRVPNKLKRDIPLWVTHGEAVDPGVGVCGYTEDNSPALVKSWETFAGNANTFQQPVSNKRKQTARRSQPHFSRLNRMPSREVFRDGLLPAMPKHGLSETTTARFADDKPFAQKGQKSRNADFLPEPLGNYTIQQEIDSLPQPPTLDIPKTPQKFSNALLTCSLGGSTSTFAKVGSAMLDKQVFECPELIKINTEAHRHAPLPGKHGALALVDGQEDSGELGKVYPLFRKSQNMWEYAGEYRAAKRKEVPVSIWKQWPSETRQSIAAKIDRTGWGQKLLLEKGLVKDDDELHSLQVKDILEFFEKPDTPNLRMSWTLLQCVGYVRAKHDILTALRDEEPNRDSPTDRLKSHSRQMVQKRSATSSIDLPPRRKRRACRTIVSSDSEDSTDSGRRPHQNNTNGSNRRTANSVKEEMDEDDISSLYSEPPSKNHSKQNTPTHGTRTLSSAPLDENHVRYSSRGRRIRKHIDYRIENPDLDKMIFGPRASSPSARKGLGR